MPSALVVQPALLSPDALALGRFVADPNNPLFDFIDPKGEDRPKFLVEPRSDFVELVENHSSSKIKSNLLGILGVKLERVVKVGYKVTAAQELEYKVVGVQAWFNEACSLLPVRTWLEGTVERNRKAYLVTGYRSITDARTSRTSYSSNGINSTFQAAGAVTTAAGIVIPTATIPVEAGIDFGNNEHERRETEHITKGEHIYAVQYQQIHFKWYSSKSVETSVLAKKNFWKLHWSMRGQKDDEDGETDEEDAVEVGLVEELEPYRCLEKFSIGDGQIEFLLVT